MNCIKWRFISWGIGFVGAVPFIMGVYSDDFWHNPLFYAGIVILAIGVIIGIWKWRCPDCGEHISDCSSVFTVKCPYCGADLTK